jgi:hypothetical protein
MTAVNDFGDPLLNSWILAWIAHALRSDPLNVFNANIFYPAAGSLLFSEPLLLPGLVFAPAAWLGASPIAMHNVLLLAGYALSGLAVFTLVRSLTSSSFAGFVAGAAFTACPYRLEVYPKVQLQLAVWVPFALVFVHRARSSSTVRSGLIAGILLALQFYTCVYYGVEGVIFAAVVIAAAAAAQAAAVRSTVSFVLAAGLSLAILAAPLGLALRSASRTVGERTLDELRRYSAEAGDYLVAHPENLLYGRRDEPGVGERRLFPGYVVPILAMVGLLAAPRRAAPYALAGIVCFWLSLGTNGFAYPVLFSHIEPLRALRVPARFAIYVNLALAVLAGLGAQRVISARSRHTTLAIGIALVAAIGLEGKSRSLDLSHLPEPSPFVYRWLRQQPHGAVCEYPFGQLQGRIGPQDSTYAYYSTIHWKPLLNGYSGFTPATYDTAYRALRTFPSDEAIAYLRAVGVRYLLVHQRFYIEAQFYSHVAALTNRADLRWIGRFPWKDGQITEVFQFEP